MKALVRGIEYTILKHEDGELWLENDDERIVVPADAPYVEIHATGALVPEDMIPAARRKARGLPTDNDA